MNAAHQVSKLKNRLKRLRKKTPDAGADKQGLMVGRIKEIEDILRKL
jgi:hypothetical protein